MTPDGEVIGNSDRLMVRASGALADDAAAAIKGVFTKAGQVRVEMHDKQAALLALGKQLNLFESNTPAPATMNVQQINVGDVAAIEVAKRLAFLFANAAEPVTIEGKAQPADQLANLPLDRAPPE